MHFPTGLYRGVKPHRTNFVPYSASIRAMKITNIQHNYTNIQHNAWGRVCVVMIGRPKQEKQVWFCTTSTNPVLVARSLLKSMFKKSVIVNCSVDVRVE
jgi:hypothetical protein